MDIKVKTYSTISGYKDEYYVSPLHLMELIYVYQNKKYGSDRLLSISFDDKQIDIDELIKNFK